MAQWVRSKYSKEAKKWEVVSEYDHYYTVLVKHVGLLVQLAVPKEEYIPCDPPDRWEVCTWEVIQAIDGLPDGQWLLYKKPPMLFAKLDEGERWAMSEKDPDALVIERKVT